jgi:hypothetical protein
MCGSNTNSRIAVPKEFQSAVSRPPIQVPEATMIAIVAGIANLGKDKRWSRVEENRFGNDEIRLQVASHKDFVTISHTISAVRSGARNFYNAAIQKLDSSITADENGRIRVWVSFEENVKGGLTVKELVDIGTKAAKGSKPKGKEKEAEIKEETEPAVAGKEAPPSQTF